MAAQLVMDIECEGIANLMICDLSTCWVSLYLIISQPSQINTIPGPTAQLQNVFVGKKGSFSWTLRNSKARGERDINVNSEFPS